MTSKRTEQLRHMLEECRQALGESIRGELAGVRKDGEVNSLSIVDDAERADVDLQADIELVFLQMKLETLRRIDDAMARLNRGLYGQCAECGNEIPVARLGALPFAVRCLGCQDNRDAVARRARESLRRPTPFRDIIGGAS